MTTLIEKVRKKRWKHNRKHNRKLLRQEICDLLQNFQTKTERESHARWFKMRGFIVRKTEFFEFIQWKVEP